MRQEVLDAPSCPATRSMWCRTASTRGVGAGSGDDGRRGGDEPLLVSWGRVQYEKGFQTFVHALPEVRQEVPGVRAVVAARARTCRTCSRGGRWGSRTSAFPGFVPDDELKRLLHEATVAVIPSFYEPFGIVALEATGRAPVLAAAPGLVEVIDGTGAGVLYPPGDAARSAVPCAACSPIPGAGRPAGRTQRLHGYTWDAVAARTVPVYTAAIAHHTA